MAAFTKKPLAWRQEVSRGSGALSGGLRLEAAAPGLFAQLPLPASLDCLKGARARQQRRVLTSSADIVAARRGSLQALEGT